METKFVGRYEHSLDVKGRLILPARFRLHFEVQAYVSKWAGRSLAIWTPPDFDSRATRMAGLLDGEQDEQVRARSFFSGSAEVDLDRQGRVGLPQYLREYAGMPDSSTVLVVGMFDHIEVWHPELWQLQEPAGDASLGGQLAAAGPAATGRA